MGRGQRREVNVQARPRLAASGEAPRYRQRRGVEPSWGEFAASRYGETFSSDLVSVEIANTFKQRVSAEQVTAYLRSRSDVVLRKRPRVLPFSHADVSPTLTAERERRIDVEAEARRAEGASDADVADFIRDERARYSRVEHLCYTDEPLFNSREMVAAISRRLKKWHRAVGRPVAGEGFEDLLAGAWSDIGLSVKLAPRNYDGADAHVELQNQWVAMSMKSESRANPLPRIHLSSLAPHHRTLNSAADCRLAIRDALEHLERYERMIYLRGTFEYFPGSDWGELAQRYLLLELPKANIARRLTRLAAADFEHFFTDAAAAASRNSFTIPVRDGRGRKLFSVTVSRQPPRVSITSIEFSYCDLIACYWTEPVDEIERLEREQEADGWYNSDGRGRDDPIVDRRRRRAVN